MIKIEGVTKKFGEAVALDRVTCSVADGSILGMIGSNGAGKSTLLRILAGVYKQDEGTVTVDGETLWDNPAAKGRIAFVPDESYFLAGSNLNRMGKLYSTLFPRFDEKRFAELTAAFGLNPSAAINTYSKGMKRQAATVLALATRSDYIFFDETFDGLDPIVRNFVKRLICEDVIDRGATAIITSHSLRELEDTCDQLAMLHRGGLVFESEVQNLRTSKFKVQIAFPEGPPEGVFDGIDVKHESRLGSVFNLIVSGDRDETVEKLKKYDPVVLEILPMTLEEVFTYELEALGYFCDASEMEELMK